MNFYRTDIDGSDFNPDNEDCLNCEFYTDCLELEEDKCLDDCEDNNSDGKTAYVSFNMTDEYGNFKAVSGSYDFCGSRNYDDCDAIITQFEGFLKACEFHMVTKENDVKLVKRDN